MPSSLISSQIEAGPKKSLWEFIASEFLIYLSQFLVFFMAAAIVSGFFRDERRLIDYVNTKITADSQFELWVTVVSLAVVLGALFAISSAISGTLQSFVQRTALEVLQEFPRLIYAVGSSVSGIAAALGLFITLNPATKAPQPMWWVLMSAFIGIGFFCAGLALSYSFKRKTHILRT